MTGAYKAKLEADQKWLAEERVREALEARNSVVKAGHMGNFYRCRCCAPARLPLQLFAACPRVLHASLQRLHSTLLDVHAAGDMCAPGCCWAVP